MTFTGKKWSPFSSIDRITILQKSLSLRQASINSSENKYESLSKLNLYQAFATSYSVYSFKKSLLYKYTLVYLKWITNKDLLHSTGNTAQYYIISLHFECAF